MVDNAESQINIRNNRKTIATIALQRLCKKKRKPKQPAVAQSAEDENLSVTVSRIQRV